MSLDELEQMANLAREDKSLNFGFVELSKAKKRILNRTEERNKDKYIKIIESWFERKLGKEYIIETDYSKIVQDARESREEERIDYAIELYLLTSGFYDNMLWD